MRNFFVTRNAWGLFSKRSHFRYDGKEKVAYNTKTADKVEAKMTEKQIERQRWQKELQLEIKHLHKDIFVPVPQ